MEKKAVGIVLIIDSSAANFPPITDCDLPN